MNLEKLKPWNWFKHEDDSARQIPVSKRETVGEFQSVSNESSLSPKNAIGSLLQIHQEMDRLFDDAWRYFGLLPSSGTRSSSFFNNSSFGNPMLGDYRAKLDISGNEKEYEVSIDLPGLTEADIQIELSGNTLTIKGKKEESKERKDKQYYCIERSVGSFQRTLSLPDDAEATDIVAKMNHGVLSMSIPRKPQTKEDTKRIPIES